MILGLHHFGMAVEDLEERIAFYGKLEFSVMKRFDYEAIGAKAALLMNGNAGIELWQFSDLSNPMAKKIQKHSALATNDLETDLQAFLNAGYELALPISKGTVVKRYAYVRDTMGNFIKLCELLAHT